MKLYSIDPGARKLGIAYFVDGALVKAATLQHEESTMAGYVVSWMSDPLADVVTERMHLRPGNTFHEDDLKRVEAVRLSIKKLRRFKRTYNPTEWKGSIPKKTHHARVELALMPSELPIWKAQNHDGRDAIAIGLFHLGRIERGGLLPGTSKWHNRSHVPPPSPSAQVAP